MCGHVADCLRVHTLSKHSTCSIVAATISGRMLLCQRCPRTDIACAANVWCLALVAMLSGMSWQCAPREQAPIWTQRYILDQHMRAQAGQECASWLAHASSSSSCSLKTPRWIQKVLSISHAASASRSNSNDKPCWQLRVGSLSRGWSRQRGATSADRWRWHFTPGHASTRGREGRAAASCRNRHRRMRCFVWAQADSQHCVRVGRRSLRLTLLHSDCLANDEKRTGSREVE